MPRENRFEVEYAKSSMATCRVCMAKIPKGALRIGHLKVEPLEGEPLAASRGKEEEGDADKLDKRMLAVSAAARWHHFECFNKMKGTKWMASNLPLNPQSLEGFHEVKKQDQKKLLALWKAILGSVASSTSLQRPSLQRPTAKEDQNKAIAAKAEAKANASPGKQRAKDTASPGAAKKRKQDDAAKISKLTSVQGVLKEKDFEHIKKLEQELMSRTTAQLQAELQKNEQVVSGKKDELVQRIAEGRQLGALPRCPRCLKGHIHWSRLGGWYSCPGYFDGDLKVQKRCNFRSQELERGKWNK